MDGVLFEVSAIIAAPFIGSFLGVLITRLPTGQGVVGGRSRCDHCDTQLKYMELVPVISWLVQRGRCRYCDKVVSIFYPVLELTSLLVALMAIWLTTGHGPILNLVSIALGWVLLVLAVIDWRHFILPDELTLPLIPAGLALTWYLWPEVLLSHALAVILGYTSLWLVAFSYKSLRGRDGLGLGDAKLFAAAGAWVGLEGLISVLLLACVLALTYAALVWALRRDMTRHTRLSLGSFLCLSFYFVFMSGIVNSGRFFVL